MMQLTPRSLELETLITGLVQSKDDANILQAVFTCIQHNVRSRTSSNTVRTIIIAAWKRTPGQRDLLDRRRHSIWKKPSNTIHTQLSIVGMGKSSTVNDKPVVLFIPSL